MHAELVKRLGELAWTLDAQDRKDDSVTCSKAAAALSVPPEGREQEREAALEEAAMFVLTRELLFARGHTTAVDDIKDYLVRGIRGLKRHRPQDDSRSKT